MIKVIDFWAPWCGPCKVLGPIVDKVAEKYADDESVEILKVNIDLDENQHYLKEFPVRSIPTMFFLKDDVVEKQTVGPRKEAEIVEIIESLR